jgi:hypothetical protein
MKKHNLFTILMPFLGILLIVLIGTALGAPKEEKVEIHTVQGSGITEGQVRGWVDNANAIDANSVKYVVDSNHVYGPNTPYEPNKNDPCRINIWGVNKKPWGDPNVSGAKVSSGTIWVVPGDGNAPSPSDPNGSGIYIKPSTLAHELNHLNGLVHSNDPNNKMYPDNDDHGDGKGTHSCHRIDTQLTPEQRTILQNSSVSYAQEVMGNGRGGEVYDKYNDVSLGFIDLDWTQAWLEWIGGHYILHLTAQVDSLSFVDFSEIGFYIESDNDLATGEPPEGLDYYLAFQPRDNKVTFQRYDPGLGWIHLPPPEEMTYELTYAYPDSNLPRIPVGVKLDIPLASFMSLSGNFAFKASATTNYIEKDLAPDANLLRYYYPPVPIPGDLNLSNKVNAADLGLMAYDWLRTGSSRADIYPPIGDGIVNFQDFAVLANNWMVP